jgi:hypothetical protein
MIKLFLPILFPSWRFFSSIGPSPRIHYTFLESESDDPDCWQEFRPKPERIPFKKSLFNLFHSPQWNEILYINTCAERLFEGYSEMREQEIMQRILAAVNLNEIQLKPEAKYLVYRISAIIREGGSVTQQVAFIAKPVQIKRIST